ncbi:MULTISPECIES: hypothetical protein [Pseudoalteromonas]|uniref:DUF883 domain-containing protein n=3 Tax=Pseudoalteromonas TaxID=53246 RepID=Q3IFZ4_PSET1|nr:MULTISPECIES: hypothetical protein [Pseudoalteromonas]ALS34055.1 hypothetical protein PTRA_a3030 [Pseudoalteromonas translucida KMM 520]ASM55129.1 hypothetical protein PNIG_a3206 [Pseudoalteromonas nigrifaciens]MBB1369294.1 DUF883 domain-containing protein [Pseudoalteromonas sp. SR45-4]MBB1405757.1 DUF883 domain-containing protein [Pseudoalteromonas sp. SG44-5]MBE0419782.1 DUF883 domain-containing protein [Pseudoalteromonas nigrifaciens]|tara:strand:+ start:59083 stop:59409 length:327 start_codon:yes stop_codon:yes gene_type:complete
MATATNTKTSTTTATKPEVNEAPFTEKATSAAHDAVDALSSKAAVAESSVRKGATSSAETLSEKQLIAREKLGEYTSKTRTLAAENPLATAGIAFAAGMLVTALFRRK